MRVALIIVNWNAGDLLGACLESVSLQQQKPDEVILVDNASTDGSLERASRLLRDVQVIRLPHNAGFARANNIGVRAARGSDLVALLNPDAVADPAWLGSLTAAAEQVPDAAAFASQIRLAESPDHLDGAGDSYHVSGRAWRNAHGKPLSAGPARDVEVFAPCAAAALYRRDAFEEVGGFDERYFCYFEDVDLAFRLRLRGYRSVYVHSAIAYHVGSALSGYRSDFAVYHGERNAVWTFFKNMPGPLFWLYLPQHVALNLASLAFYPWRGQGRTVFRAKFDAVRSLPAVLRQRAAIQRERRIRSSTLRRALRRNALAPYFSRYSLPGRT